MTGKPALGRIVHFQDGPVTFAALIAAVKEGVVDLTVFDPHTGPRSLLNISYSEKLADGRWSWPPEAT